MNKIDFVIFGAIDWSSDWITQHRLAQSLSKDGHRVLFVENTGVRSIKISDFPRIIKRVKNWIKSVRGFTKIDKNLSLFSPLVIPFPYSSIATNINSLFFNRILRYWMNKNRYNNVVFITFLATPLISKFIEDSTHILKIYYASDDHEFASQNKNFILSENEIKNSSNAIFTTSQKLFEKFENSNKNVYKISAGVELEKFKELSDNLVPEDLKNIPKPIIGFIGGINNKIDKELFLKLAKKLNEYSFVMLGNEDSDLKKELINEENIFLLGKKKHKDLSRYIQNFSCGIIPYKINKFTDAVYPSKLNEFLAMGKPIVTSNIYEMEFFNKENQNIIDIAYNENDFINLIKKNVNEDNLEKIKNRKLIASNNSWVLKFNKLSGIIQELTTIKKTENIDWEKKFNTEFKKVKNKIRKYFLIFLTLFIILFISPIPYYISKTLIINDIPKKADVIVGLSGYGQANYTNNSYQQRALDVYYYYSKGFAEQIILSGRKQLVEEFTLMKSLLNSLGVNKKDIIVLKKNSGSTLENLINLNEIMNENNFSSANIITSSFHQKRLKFIAKKILKDKEIYILGETNSEKINKWFFGYQKIKVVIYEMLSIIYNWFKLR